MNYLHIFVWARKHLHLVFSLFVLTGVSKIFDQNISKFQKYTKNSEDDNIQSQDRNWYSVSATVLTNATWEPSKLRRAVAFIFSQQNLVKKGLDKLFGKTSYV